MSPRCLDRLWCDRPLIAVNPPYLFELNTSLLLGELSSEEPPHYRLTRLLRHLSDSIHLYPSADISTHIVWVVHIVKCLPEVIACLVDLMLVVFFFHDLICVSNLRYVQLLIQGVVP